jgi:hypothetical protein
LSSSQVRDRGRKRIHLRDAARSLVAASSCPLNCQGCGLDVDVFDDWLWVMDIGLGGQAEPATGE